MGLLGVMHRESCELHAFLEHILARGPTTVVSLSLRVRAFRLVFRGMKSARWLWTTTFAMRFHEWREQDVRSVRERPRPSRADAVTADNLRNLLGQMCRQTACKGLIGVVSLQITVAIRILVPTDGTRLSFLQ